MFEFFKIRNVRIVANYAAGSCWWSVTVAPSPTPSFPVTWPSAGSTWRHTAELWRTGTAPCRPCSRSALWSAPTDVFRSTTNSWYSGRENNSPECLSSLELTGTTPSYATSRSLISLAASSYLSSILLILLHITLRETIVHDIVLRM